MSEAGKYTREMQCKSTPAEKGRKTAECWAATTAAGSVAGLVVATAGPWAAVWVAMSAAGSAVGSVAATAGETAAV